MLQADQLSKAYGARTVVDRVSLRARPDEILGLLGPNGAGKTTTISMLCGLTASDSGTVSINGRPMGNSGDDIDAAKRRIGLVPQGRRVFASLSVRENLLVASRAPRHEAGTSWSMEDVFVTFPRLGQRRAQAAGLLSGGEQQMLAIGRALVSNPQLLMLDEPSLGLASRVTTELMAVVKRLRAELGMTVLLVEQNARKSLAIADRGYLIENGHIVGTGRAADLASDPAVQRAYLGGAR